MRVIIDAHPDDEDKKIVVGLDDTSYGEVSGFVDLVIRREGKQAVEATVPIEELYRAYLPFMDKYYQETKDLA